MPLSPVTIFTKSTLQPQTFTAADADKHQLTSEPKQNTVAFYISTFNRHGWHPYNLD